MNANRFDALAKTLAAGLTRRNALRRIGGGGLAVALLGGIVGRRGAAQESGSPAATAPLPPPSKSLEYLFVQTFTGGSAAPADSGEGIFTLRLDHGLAQTLYFAERPSRLAGMLPTAEFLQHLSFDPADPPNAALVARTEGGEIVVVVALTNPRHDEATGTMTYDARISADNERAKLGYFQLRQIDQAIPERFGAASLFIDSAKECYGCGDACYTNSNCCPGLSCRGASNDMTGACSASCCGGGCDCGC